MKKLITLLTAVFVTLSLSAQKVHTHHSFLDKAFQNNELPDSLVGQKYSKYLPQQQRSSSINQFKNSNVEKQQLDMIYSADQEKNEFYYDDQGNLIEDIVYGWFDNQWESLWKTEYIYDNNGNNTQYTAFEWGEDQWLNEYRYEAAFDSDGNNTLSLSYTWDGTEWVTDNSKDEFSYDAKGNLTEHISSYWYETQFINSGKQEFIYDDNGNQIQELRYQWNGSAWSNEMKEESVYDDKDKLSLIINYYWDGAQWVNSDQTEFTYGSNEELLTIVYSGWDGNDWINPEKFENIYDSSGNISQTTISYLEGEQWIVDLTMDYEFDSMGNRTLLDVYYADINYYREESVYDEYGNRVEYSVYQFDWESEIIANSQKIETSYDNSYAFEDLILPFIYENFEEEDYNYDDYEEDELSPELLFNHKLLRMVSYEGDGENWLVESDFTLVYSEQNISSISQENFENKMSVYPNPTSSQLTFFLEELADSFQIKIFDIQGKMVISRAGENNKPFSLESLHDGIYFYRLESPGNILTGKILVKN